MSTPQNILNTYASYAYHHILIATNSTTIFETSQDSNKNPVGSIIDKLFSEKSHFTRNTTDKKRDLQKQIIHSGTEGTAMMVINSAQDTDFFIKDISWSNIFLPNERDDDGKELISPHEQVVEGTMIIEEPKGARFFKYLNDICDVLQTDPIGVIFAIKTVFVGFPSNTSGKNEADNPTIPQIINVNQAFPFVIYDIANEFSATGSSYTISFLGAVSGVSRLPIFQRLPSVLGQPNGGYKLEAEKLNFKEQNAVIETIRASLKDQNITTEEEARKEVAKNTKLRSLAEGVGIDIESSPFLTAPTIVRPTDKYPTLESFCLALEQVWNNESFKQYKKVEDTVTNLKDFKRRWATIKIVLDDVYRDWFIDEPNKAKPEQDKYLADNITGGDSDGKITTIIFDPECTVEQALQDIMDSSKKVAKDKDVGEEDGKGNYIKYTYKIVSELKSTVEFDEKKFNYYQEIKRKYPKTLNNNMYYNGYFQMTYYIERHKIPAKLDGTRLSTNDKSDSNQLVATPDNVLEFDYIFTGKNIDIIDMDMKMDMGYLAFTALAPKREIRTPDDPSDTNQTSAKQSSDTQFGKDRKYSPIGPAYLSTGEFKVNQRPLALEYLSARQVLNDLSIFSVIDAKVTIRGNPVLMNDVCKPFIPDGSRKSEIKSVLEKNSDGSNESVLDFRKRMALVKINIRMISDDYEEGNHTADLYTEPFWYNDYYIIIGVENRFSEGEFTQTLDLVPLVNDGTLAKIFGAQEQNQYQIFTPTKEQLRAASYVQKNANNTLINRERDNLKQTTSLTQSFTPKQYRERFAPLIRKVEQEYDMPEGMLERIIDIESYHYREDVIKGHTPSHRGAIGIAQFMRKTADEFGVDPFDPVSSIEGAGRYLAYLKLKTGDWLSAVASYNWGPENVKQVKEQYKQSWVSKLPPVTQKYIGDVFI